MSEVKVYHYLVDRMMENKYTNTDGDTTSEFVLKQDYDDLVGHFKKIARQLQKSEEYLKAEYDAKLKHFEGKLELRAKLDKAMEGLETIRMGIDPHSGEWSEQFQDELLKMFTAKTASDYATKILKEIKGEEK